MNDQTDRKYCGSDGIHLSIEGKRVILADMRHHIHLISKRSDQPIRTRVYKYCSRYIDDLNIPNANQEICRIICNDIYPEYLG